MAKLFEMNPSRALAFCVKITSEEWSRLIKMEGEDLDRDVLALWAVFRAYIANEYDDTNLTVPARIGAEWSRCKTIIDNALISDENGND